MTDFTHFDQNNAPEESKPLLENSLKKNGRIPGLHAVMAGAPGLLAAYAVAHEQFMNSSFDADEKTVVWQTVNVEQECHYCVPAHTGIAKMMKVDDAITDALRDETPLPTPKLEALRVFTLLVVRNRGNLSEAEVQTFLDAGFTKQQILEVILGVAQKVMSNYTNHFAGTPIDGVFQKYSWQKAS